MIKIPSTDLNEMQKLMQHKVTRDCLSDYGGGVLCEKCKRREALISRHWKALLTAYMEEARTRPGGPDG